MIDNQVREKAHTQLTMDHAQAARIMVVVSWYVVGGREIDGSSGRSQ